MRPSASKAAPTSSLRACPAANASASPSRALLNDPELLLCDEPAGNLDSVTTGAILELLAGLHRDGLTIVTITHDPGVAARAERQVRIADGRIVGDR